MSDGGTLHQKRTHAELQKPRPRMLDRRAEARATARAWQETKAEVKFRESGRCRLCSAPGAEVHHITYRSRGGKHEARNAVLLCRRCHTEVHGGIVKLAGNASGRKGVRVARYSETAKAFVWQERTV